jgi:hypothetical protein
MRVASRILADAGVECPPVPTHQSHEVFHPEGDPADTVMFCHRDIDENIRLESRIVDRPLFYKTSAGDIQGCESVVANMFQPDPLLSQVVHHLYHSAGHVTASGIIAGPVKDHDVLRPALEAHLNHRPDHLRVGVCGLLYPSVPSHVWFYQH